MVVNNATLKYSLIEYALITDLNCSKLSNTAGLQAINAFKQRHWLQQKTVSLNDVVSRIKNIEELYGDGKKKNDAIIICRWCVNNQQ